MARMTRLFLTTVVVLATACTVLGIPSRVPRTQIPATNIKSLDVLEALFEAGPTSKAAWDVNTNLPIFVVEFEGMLSPAEAKDMAANAGQEGGSVWRIFPGTGWMLGSFPKTLVSDFLGRGFSVLSKEPQGDDPLEEDPLVSIRKRVDEAFKKTPTQRDAVKPRVIYGDDDRKEVTEISDATVQGMIPNDVVVTDIGLVACDLVDCELSTVPWTRGGALCPTEPFYGQPDLGFCSGFQVGPDIIVTAGHCIQSESECLSTAFVFDFQHSPSGFPSPWIVPLDNVYYCTEIIQQALSGSGPDLLDYAIVRVDKIIPRPPVPVQAGPDISVGTKVGVIGHPQGIPTKVALGDDTEVKAVYNTFFEANTDTYGGNSGSMCINPQTGIVEGILVRGATDFILDGSCLVSNQCDDDTGCGGFFEECSLASSFVSHIPTGDVVLAPGDDAMLTEITTSTVYTLFNSGSAATFTASLDSYASFTLNGGTADLIDQLLPTSTLVTLLIEASQTTHFATVVLTVSASDGSVHTRTITMCPSDCGDGHCCPLESSSSCSLDCTCDSSTCLEACNILLDIAETGSTAGAPNDGITSCGAASTSPAHFYSFTAPFTGTFTAHTIGSDYDTVLTAYSDCPADGATEIACNDDIGMGDLQSMIEMHLPVGTSILLRVSGYSGAFGNYNLELHGEPDSVEGDPHFFGYHGGQYDVMGSPNHVFNLLSYPGFSVNGRFIQYVGDDATYIGEVGILVQSPQGTTDRIVLDTSGMTTVTPFRQGPGEGHALLDNGGTVSYRGQTLVVESAPWRVSISRKVALHDLTSFHLDVEFSTLDDEVPSVCPHGLWGQTVCHEGRAVGHGEQGEGVIEGVWTEYMIPSDDLFDPDFAYSRYTH